MTTKSIFVSSLLAITTITGLGLDHASADTVPVTDSYVMPGTTTTTSTSLTSTDPSTDPLAGAAAPITDVFGNMAGDGSNVNWYACKAAAIATKGACLAIPVAADFIAGFAAGPIGILLLELTGLPLDAIKSCDDLYNAQIVGCWLNYNGTRGPGG